MANCLHPAVFRLFPRLIQVVFLQGKSLEFLSRNSGWQNAERPKKRNKNDHTSAAAPPALQSACNRRRLHPRDPQILKKEALWKFRSTPRTSAEPNSLPAPASSTSAHRTPSAWIGSLSVCPQHGFVYGQMHFKRTSANTLIMHQRAYPASREDVEDVRERYRLYLLTPPKKRHHRLYMEEIVEKAEKARE